MTQLASRLVLLYIPLVGWVLLGLVLGHRLPQRWCNGLGKFLFWIGVPISVIGFLRGVDLSGPVWAAPAIAWGAIAVGALLAGLWISWETTGMRRPRHSSGSVAPPSATRLHQSATQGSFLLASMVGNTGYLGYPVTLALVGVQHFGWALFYDMGGTMIGAYGVGVLLASRMGQASPQLRQPLLAILINPALWSFGVGLVLRPISFSASVETALQAGAWGSVALSLVLIGMRLSQLRSWQHTRLACISLSFKMVLVPLVLGLLLTAAGLSGAPRLALVLQMAMPPAFATLVIGEAYNLDRDLTVTALAIGSVVLLAMLPVWVWLFPV
ncbi:MAG: AEC family transporter [Kaiparowitsia implicata GSE-PSE-MK54-09C]|jgi:predicted permease|nr:AEC family transporter [Kaiparowitsia implicata GSE-PSE-MK54-09C]